MLAGSARPDTPGLPCSCLMSFSAHPLTATSLAQASQSLEGKYRAVAEFPVMSAKEPASLRLVRIRPYVCHVGADVILRRAT